MDVRGGHYLSSGFSLEVDKAPLSLLPTWILLLRRSTRAECVPLHFLQENKILLAEVGIAENVKFLEYCDRVNVCMEKAKYLNKVDSSAVMKGLRGKKSITTPNFTLGVSMLGSSVQGCDLELRIKKYQAEVVYSPKLFEVDAIQLLGERFIALLDSIKQSPNLVVSSLPMMNVDMEKTILCDWNDTSHKWPESHCIHHLFLEQVT